MKVWKAIKLMIKHGKKVKHKEWEPYEFIHWKKGFIITEDAEIYSRNIFNKAIKGWEVVDEKKPTINPPGRGVLQNIPPPPPPQYPKGRR